MNDKEYVISLLEKALKNRRVSWNHWHDGMREELDKFRNDEGKIIYKGFIFTITYGNATFFDNAGTAFLVRLSRYKKRDELNE